MGVIINIPSSGFGNRGSKIYHHTHGGVNMLFRLLLLSVVCVPLIGCASRTMVPTTADAGKKGRHMYIKKANDCQAFSPFEGETVRELLPVGKDGAGSKYSLAHIQLAPGKKINRYRLKKPEAYYILAGTGRVRVDDEATEVSAGCIVYVPPGTVRSLENTGRNDLVFLDIVDPAFQPADMEMIEK